MSGWARRSHVTDFDGLDIRDTRHGKGVFVLHPVAPGERILTFRGKPLDFAGTLAKGDREGDALQIGVDAYLDLDPPGRFVNHSCEPNAGVRDRVQLISLRELAAGEEVRFDYSTTMSENHWTMECSCGSSRCRRLVRDFRWIPLRRKLELIRQGVVPAFLVEEELASGRLHAAQVPSLPLESEPAV